MLVITWKTQTEEVKFVSVLQFEAGITVWRISNSLRLPLQVKKQMLTLQHASEFELG